MNTEPDLEYKKRVLDPKSLSFCGAKWYNATIWLGSGKTTSCHHPPSHPIDLTLATENPKAIHNTLEKKFDRAKMQRGVRPKGCEYCWKIEDMGPDFISDRIYKSRIYSESDLEHAFQENWENDFNLRTLEIAFDRTCNFACSYCNPEFSSTWVNDIRDSGPYHGLITDGRNHFVHTHEKAQPFKSESNNPYVEAFLKWWESDLHKTLQELRITGGEPTMSPDFWRFLDWFSDRKNKSHVRLAINSNLGGKPEIIDKLIEKTKNVKELHLYTSCESLEKQAEYIRDGLKWDHWVKNFEKILNTQHIQGVHVMCTVNALCLGALPNFLEMLIGYKKRLGSHRPIFTLNILRFPTFQSPLILPEKVKQDASQKLSAFLAQWKNSGLLIDIEINHLDRLIKYLTAVEQPVGSHVDMGLLAADFKCFYGQYDMRRGKSLVKTFPYLADWYQSL